MIEFEFRHNQNQQAHQAALDLLEHWFGTEMADAYSRPATGQGLLLGGAVWGRRYFTRFLDYVVRSILAGRAALAGRATFLIYTDHAMHAEMIGALKHLPDMGIGIEIRLMPPAIVDLAREGPVPKLWTVGVAHQAAAHIAGRRGMAFHMLLADHLYEPSYFPRLFELGEIHPGIAQNGVSMDLVTGSADIERYRTPEGLLHIPAAELGRLAVDHMHGQTRSACVTTDNPLPASHHIIWRGQNALHQLNCRQNAAWMAPQLCRAAPTRIPHALDAAIPFYIPEPYFPRPDDGLAFIEVSDSRKYVAPARLPTWDHYVAAFWSAANFDNRYMAYTDRLGVLPAPHDPEAMPDADIHAAHAAVLQRLQRQYGEACRAFAMAMAVGKAL